MCVYHLITAGPHTGCKRAILFPNLKISSHTHKWASDWFIVGHAEDMDHMLDHYLGTDRADTFKRYSSSILYLKCF